MKKVMQNLLPYTLEQEVSEAMQNQLITVVLLHKSNQNSGNSNKSC